MRVAILSTFPPRQCGIATFSSDLYDAMVDAPGVTQVDVIAIANSEVTTVTPPVVGTISQEVRDDYHRAAGLVSRLGIDVVLIEHEYGIFGGSSGEYVLSFTTSLAVPYVVTLHTVLSSPSESQAHVLKSLCAGAASVLVFTETARRIVLEQELAPPRRVVVVPHGAPVEITAVASRPEPSVPMALWHAGHASGATTSDRFVVTTFGLLSSGKGLESAIEAIALVAKDHPEVLYVIAGATHPEVVRRDGESYRLSLLQKVRELGVGDQVIFDDRFLSVDELATLLGATNLFVTSYRGSEQTVSGALTFAVAAGRPVVSTPYRYAEDLLKDGAGSIVPAEDPVALAHAITELIESPDKLDEMQRAARRAGEPLSWPAVGRETAALLNRASRRARPAVEPTVAALDLPPVRLDHLSTLLDDAGIIQHAFGSVPNRMSGYCVDDVARLAQVTSALALRTGDATWLTSTARSVAFLRHAAEGASGPELHNFMSYDRRWIGFAHHGDHVGRAIWALGQLAGDPLPRSLKVPAGELLDTLSNGLIESKPSARVGAYSILGLIRAAQHDRREQIEPTVKALASDLTDRYRAESDARWRWFEPAITYDNARLPQALLAAGWFLDQPEWIEIGLETLAWLGDRCGLSGGLITLPGNLWQRKDDVSPSGGDEQPIDAAALVEAEIEAYGITKDQEHARRAKRAFEWFLGRNHLGLPIYDASTGGCRDGLSTHDVSLNQGAESTLAYLTARLAIEATDLNTSGPTGARLPLADAQG